MAHRHGLEAVLTSHHPYLTRFVPDPPLNAYEQELLHQSPEDLSALLSMVTYGPDLNFSMPGLSVEQQIDLGQKLTYYSPCIVPWSFSSPFYDGGLWEGLSVRTFHRAGRRPAVQVFLAQPGDLLESDPSLTKLARYPAEVGRIEWKACDSCADFSLYAALFALLKGLALDETASWTSDDPGPSTSSASSTCRFRTGRSASRGPNHPVGSHRSPGERS